MNRVMKDSGIEWIGEIPENWKIVSLKRLGTPLTGSTPSKSRQEYWNGRIPWVSAKDIKSNYIFDSEDHITKEAVDECGLTVFETGTLIFCVRSGILRHTFPVSVSSIPVTINQDLRALNPSEETNPAFLLYYMRGMNDTIVNLYQKIGATVESIEMDWFLYFPIVLPPLIEQNQIVELIDKKYAEIDLLIAAKEKTNSLLKEWRQSIIYEAVTKGLDSNVPMKDSGIEWIGKIPASWNTAPLRSKFSFGKGLTITKSDLADDGFCVISYGQIHSKDNVGICVNDSLIKYISKSHKSLVDSAKTNVGDFIFADTSEDIQGCGNNVYIDRDDCIYAGYHTLILRSKNSRQNKYYAYLFSSDAWRAQVRARVSGVKLYSITQGILKSTTLLVPPPSEQDRIIEYLDAKCNKIDLAITQNNVTIQQLKEYRQSLIYEAVTGKTNI